MTGAFEHRAHLAEDDHSFVATLTAGVSDLVLRPEVEVTSSSVGAVQVRYALWEMVLPSEAVQGAPGLARLLAERRVSRSALGTGSAARIVAFLAAQGCILPELPDEIRVKDVPRLFDPVRSRLYAEYYAHPLWKRLRSGSASRGELVAWIVHNYHISRSAGPIAARMGIRSAMPDLQAFFREDSLEEYWHCDAFYFAGGGELVLRPDMVKAYVPLAASTAFEEQALRTADEDWLGHLLIAYFQEASILFRDDSEDFYSTVEQAYGIEGFFAGWRRHMTLDLDHGHADGLRRMFDSDAPIAFPDLVRSFRSVQLAHFFLMRALDQIAVHSDAVNALSARQPAAFIGLNGKVAMPAGETSCAGKQDEACGRYIIATLGDASFRALANSRSHDDIIMAGRLAAAVSRVRDEYALLPGFTEAAGDLANPWVVAVRNFVVECSHRVGILVELTGDLLAAAKEFDPSLQISALEEQLERLAAQLPPDRAAIEKAQLRELLALARSREVLQPLVLGRAPAESALPAHHAQA